MKRQFEVRDPQSNTLIGSYTVEGIVGDLSQYSVSEVEYSPANIADAINDTISKINAYTGEVRGRFATDVAFQSTAYERKLQSCLDWDEAGRPEDLTPYTQLTDEVAITGATAAQVFTVITTEAVKWDGLLDITERLRRSYSEQAKLIPVFAELNPLYNDFVLQIELAVK